MLQIQICSLHEQLDIWAIQQWWKLTKSLVKFTFLEHLHFINTLCYLCSTTFQGRVFTVLHRRNVTRQTAKKLSSSINCMLMHKQQLSSNITTQLARTEMFMLGLQRGGGFPVNFHRNFMYGILKILEYIEICWNLYKRYLIQTLI